MKKKVLTLVVLMVLVLAPTFANSLFNNSTNFGLGVAVGTNNGVSAKYKIDNDWTVGGVVGLSASGGLGINAVGLMNITQFEIEKTKIDVNAGAGVALDVSSTFGLDVLGAVELSHSFEGDLPIDLVLRLEPGLAILPKVAFGMQATLQGLYRLNL